MLQSPGTLRDCQRLWRPAVTRSVPRSLAPLCTQESELDTKEPRVSVQGRNVTSCFSELPGARPPPARTPLRFGRSSQSQREPVPHPYRSRCSHRSSGGSPPAGALGLVAPSGWAQWPRLLPLATGPAPALPSFSKSLQPAPRNPSPPPPRRPLPYLSPGNTWLRGSPERSFLGAYSLTREEKGTERQKRDRSRRLGVFPPAQPSRGGDARGGAAEVWRSGVRQRQGSAACSGIRGSKAVLVRGPLLRHCGSLPAAAW